MLQEIWYSYNFFQTNEFSFYFADLPTHQDIVEIQDNSENSNQRNELDSINDDSKLQKFFKKNYTVYVTPQVPVDLDVTKENLYFSNIEFFTGAGYEATESEPQNRNEQNRIMEQNRVMEENPATEQRNRNCGTEKETNTHNSHVENDVGDEMQSSNCINPVEIHGTNDNISSNTSQLANGLSGGIGVEDMDIVSDDVNHENPSSR